jgi:reactive intermediate/imine deaminase
MRKTIHTDQAPAAIGPYSQAVQAGNLVFLSGQVPLNPVTMELVEGDFEAGAHQVFKNLKAVAKASGGDMGDMVKLTVYLTDMSKFPRINDVMAQYFTEPYPARAAIAVRELPKGADVEIDAIMMLPAGD